MFKELFTEKLSTKELFTEGFFKPSKPETYDDYKKSKEPTLEDKIDYITFESPSQFKLIAKLVKKYSGIDMYKTELVFDDLAVKLKDKDIEAIYNKVSGS